VKESSGVAGVKWDTIRTTLGMTLRFPHLESKLRKNICYHTRQVGTDQKISGGSFGGDIDNETVDRLVNVHFTVKVKPSGHAVFVDKQGRDVSLYLFIDPDRTAVGKFALKLFREERMREQQIAEDREKEQQEEIESLMEGLSHEEIVRRLSTKPQLPEDD
jgi:hypothetical protein